MKKFVFAGLKRCAKFVLRGNRYAFQELRLVEIPQASCYYEG